MNYGIAKNDFWRGMLMKRLVRVAAEVFEWLCGRTVGFGFGVWMVAMAVRWMVGYDDNVWTAVMTLVACMLVVRPVGLAGMVLMLGILDGQK